MPEDRENKPSARQKRVMNDMVAVKKTSPTPEVVRSQPKPIERPVVQKKETAPDPVPVAPRRNYQEPARLPEGSSRKISVGLVFIICIAILTVVIGGLFSRAIVTVHEKTFSGTVNTTLSFSKNRESGSVFFATATKTFTDEVIVPATGVIAEPSKATGKIRFYNKATKSKTIPAATVIVSSEGVEYETIKSVTVPAYKGSTPGQIEVTVNARQVGGQANTDADDFTFAVTKNFPDITIQAVAPITGGSASSDLIADPQQIEEAKDTLRNRLADPSVSTGRVAAVIPENFISLPIPIAPTNPVITVDPSQPDGVHVKATQTVMLVLAERSGLAQALGKSLNADTSINLDIKDISGLAFVTGATFSPLIDPGSFSARITGDAQVVGKTDLEQIKTVLLGKSRSEAKTVFGQYPEIDDFSIKMFPPWRRILPVSLDDIEVKNL